MLLPPCRSKADGQMRVLASEIKELVKDLEQGEGEERAQQDSEQPGLPPSNCYLNFDFDPLLKSLDLNSKQRRWSAQERILNLKM